MSEIRNENGVISIRDEGVGISKEATKRIFDRFYRVDLSRTEATGGTGLGLAIVKRIIEIHNGKIEIDSEMGKGTKISIVLPINEKEIMAKNEKSNKKNRTKEKSSSFFKFLKKRKVKNKKEKIK